MTEAVIVAVITGLATISVAWIGTRKDRAAIRGIDKQINQINHRPNDMPSVSEQVDHIAAAAHQMRLAQARIERTLEGNEKRLARLELELIATKDS